MPWSSKWSAGGVKDCSATDLTFWLTSSFFALDIEARLVGSWVERSTAAQQRVEISVGSLSIWELWGRPFLFSLQECEGGWDYIIVLLLKAKFSSFAQPVPQLLYRLPLVFSTPDVMLGVYVFFEGLYRLWFWTLVICQKRWHWNCIGRNLSA